MTTAFPTQSDVAKLSKVSRSTVAEILRTDPDDSPFAEDTRRRVMDAVKKLNYRPNSAAGSLRSGRTHTIAFTIPNFQSIHTALQAQKLRGVGQRAGELGYSLSISGYKEHSNLRTTFRRLVREGRFDGVVFHGYINQQEDEREAILSEIGVPYVVMEKTTQNSTCVDFDSIEGGRLATEHLLKVGKRKIAFIGNSDCGIPYRQRYMGYCAALDSAAIPVDPDYVIPMISGQLIETGRLGIEQLMNQKLPFDAVFCATDYTAMGAMQTLLSAGMSIGAGAGQIAVVGYDNDPVAEMAWPPLTTVVQDGVQMGRLAMELLHKAIEARGAGTEMATQQHRVYPTLAVRESSGSKVGYPLTAATQKNKIS